MEEVVVGVRSYVLDTAFPTYRNVDLSDEGIADKLCACRCPESWEDGQYTRRDCIPIIK